VIGWLVNTAGSSCRRGCEVGEVHHTGFVVTDCWRTPCVCPPHTHTRRCPGLANAPGGAEWWEAEFELPAALFKADFVVVDKNTGGVDNNKAKVSGLQGGGVVHPVQGAWGQPCSHQARWTCRVAAEAPCSVQSATQIVCAHLKLTTILRLSCSRHPPTYPHTGLLTAPVGWPH
jgi:hypothetical protein